ncbi:MAG: glycosyltransferase [Luteitalea sp.]|nr:glycosyltransferase [Luteitalea sp.]
MRIAVDARELSERPTGVGRYLAELLAGWTRSPTARAHELLLYTTAAPSSREAIIGTGGATVAWRALPGTSNLLWEQHHLARAVRHERPDVLFCPAYSAPLAIRVPVVLTLHDISFVAHPEWFGWREGLRRRLLARLSARRARRLVTMSRFSAGEITQRLRVPADRIATIPLAVDHRLGAKAHAEEGTGRREPLVLYVGSIFNRRNVPALIRAFSRLVDTQPDAHLAIVGENRSHPREPIARCIAESSRAAHITWKPYVSEDELAALYSRASIFAFLSTYEGFGLTPLEALAAGMPIVVADTPVAREVYGDAAAFVDPHHEEEVAGVMARLLSGGDQRTAILEAAPHVLRRYRWEATAAATLRVLEEAAR